VLALLLPLAGSGCARGGPETPEPAASPVRVEVVNNYALAMEVDVVGAGVSHRLGTVHPGMVGHFVVPPGMIGGSSIEFLAHPSANERQVARSGPLLVNPGRVVEFVITPRLFNSTATIRP